MAMHRYPKTRKPRDRYVYHGVPIVRNQGAWWIVTDRGPVRQSSLTAARAVIREARAK